jgi:hypothetical protein
MGPGNSKEGTEKMDYGVPAIRRTKILGLFRKDRERITVKLTQRKYKNLDFASPPDGEQKIFC